MFSTEITYKHADFEMDVGITLEPGKIHALIGESGSGKSTLLRLLSGLLTPTEGLINSGDRILFDSVKGINLVPQKRNVGLVFQDYALFDHMTIFQNIAYGVSVSNQHYVVQDWLEKMGLSNKADLYPEQLSGGEKQRVALARVLAASPDILLMDEPFSALNTQLRLQLRRDLRQLIRDSGVPVLIAIHDLEEAQMLADQVTILSKGKVVQTGEVQNVFAAPNSVASAHALGWHNVLKCEMLPFRLYERQMKKPAYMVIPATAFTLSEGIADLKATVLDSVSLQFTTYYDVRTESGDILQLELSKDSPRLIIAEQYHFKVNESQLMFIN